MIEHFEGPLSPDQRRTLDARVGRLRRDQRFALAKAGAASTAVCAVLALLTIAASNAPSAVILLCWGMVAAVLTAWIGLPERRRSMLRAAMLAEALRADRARGIRIQSARVVEFEEVGDEGACYAFDVGNAAGGDRVIFVQGQQFYPIPSFPSTDFTLVEVLTERGAVADELFEVGGGPLLPERRISRALKARLAIPDHLEVLVVALDDLEMHLAPAPS